MPRPKENAPAPVQFNLQDLQVGRKKFRSGSSAPAVQLNDRLMAEGLQRKLQRNETFLCGKILFGNKRFSFEVMEMDRSAGNIAKLLRNKDENFAPTFFDMMIASTRCPVQSFQVKCEDVLSMECRQLHEEWELVLNLKKPLSCYAKTNGGSWQTAANPGAKTISCRTAAPDERKTGWQCENQESTAVI